MSALRPTAVPPMQPGLIQTDTPTGLTTVTVAESADVLATCARFGDPLVSLSPPELARLARLRVPQDRDDLVAARILARLLVVQEQGQLPSTKTLAGVGLRQRCGECGGPHGRPWVTGRERLGISWAHTRGVVAVALGDGPVGVDVERRIGDVPRLVDRSGHPAAASLEAWLGWTRGETLVKAGLADLDEVQRWPLTGPPADHAAVTLVELVRRCHDLGRPPIGLTDQVWTRPGEADVVVSVASYSPVGLLPLDRLLHPLRSAG